MFRKFLDTLYLVSGILGASFLVLIGVIMLLQMIARAAGFQIRGADDLTAWSVAATAMLSLAYAFRHGAHIRVTILIGSCKGKVRKYNDTICLMVAAVMASILTYASIRLTYDSWQYHEIAHGLLKIPLWIPQLSMSVGAVIFFIAIVDDLIEVICDREPSYNGYSDGI